MPPEDQANRRPRPPQQLAVVTAVRVADAPPPKPGSARREATCGYEGGDPGRESLRGKPMVSLSRSMSRPGVERVAEAVAEEVERQRRDQHGEARPEHQPRLNRVVLGSLLEQVA